jgi:cryptochrome
MGDFAGRVKYIITVNLKSTGLKARLLLGLIHAIFFKFSFSFESMKWHPGSLSLCLSRHYFFPQASRSLTYATCNPKLSYYSMAPRVIYWFRTDLRLHDSPALKAALDLNPECLYPIWTWDPHYVYRARVGVNRWQFLLECQKDLSESITKLNKKSKLFVMREAPQTLLPKLFKAWKISHLVFEKDTDAYARERDDEIKKLAEKAGVTVITKSGRTLWDSEELVKQNHGKPTMSISTVISVAKKIGDPNRPVDRPKSLPDPGDTKLGFEHKQPEIKPDLNGGQRKSKENSYAKIAGPHGDFSVPTMEELGLKPATTMHHGGETIALKLLEEVIKDKDYTAKFEKPKTAPTAFEPQATTLWSPHFHFGTLSIREAYWKVQEVVSKYKGASQPPTSLIGQLIFRDMYFGAQYALGRNFTQTLNNPQVRFIPWHLPSKHDPKTGYSTGEYEVDSPQAEEWFTRWKHGQTGFPWIDAIMRQLREEGWIHHLARHAVACFLTRGGCYIHWERGQEVFEEFLLDHEPACNSGNWQWLSCTAFFAQFFRCYSPISFPQKWDKTGQFVRRYVPELKKYPDKYIYEPWKCPVADQKKAGCRIEGNGLDKIDNDKATNSNKEDLHGTYPKPMFDFPARREFCLRAMKKAYSVGLHGTDVKVHDGSWREDFDDADEDDIDAGAPHSTADKQAAKRTERGEDRSDVLTKGDDKDVEEQAGAGVEKKENKHAGEKRKADGGQTKLNFRGRKRAKD